MTKFLFSKNQNEIFEKQFDDYKSELKIWNITNYIVPTLIIIIPCLFYVFLPPEKANFNNLILNGSFSLLGINILFTMSIFLINSLKMKDAKIEQDITSIRQRLVIYLAALLIFGSFVYVLQIMYAIDTNPKTLTIVVSGGLIFYFSIGIGKRVYSIKDELVGKTIDEDVRENVIELKHATDDLE